METEALERQAALLATFEAKHQGPGPHPGTGSPQAVHAGGGAPRVPRVLVDGVEIGPLLAPPAILAAAQPEIQTKMTPEEIDDVVDAIRRGTERLTGNQPSFDDTFEAEAAAALTEFDRNARIAVTVGRDVRVAGGGYPTSARAAYSQLLRRRIGDGDADRGAWQLVRATMELDHEIATNPRYEGVEPQSWDELRSTPEGRFAASFALGIPSVPEDMVMKAHVMRRIGARLRETVDEDFILHFLENDASYGYLGANIRAALDNPIFAGTATPEEAAGFGTLMPHSEGRYVLARRPNGGLDVVQLPETDDEELQFPMAAEADAAWRRNRESFLDTPEKVRAGLAEVTASFLITKWAGSSNDSDKISLALQMAAEDEFEIEGAADWDYGRHSPFLERDVRDAYEDHYDLFRSFLRAQHDETQEMFAAEGITHVELFRGFRWKRWDERPQWAKDVETVEVPDFAPSVTEYLGDGVFRVSNPDASDTWFTIDQKTDAVTEVGDGVDRHILAAQIGYHRKRAIRGEDGNVWRDALDDYMREYAQMRVTIPLRPMSSTSTNGHTATDFAGDNGLTVHLVVPVERIIGTPRTGVGCLGEEEFVILGGPADVRIVE